MRKQHLLSRLPASKVRDGIRRLEFVLCFIAYKLDCVYKGVDMDSRKEEDCSCSRNIGFRYGPCLRRKLVQSLIERWEIL